MTHLTEVDESVLNFTNTVRAVLTSQNLTVSDILNYYLNLTRTNPSLRKSSPQLMLMNLRQAVDSGTANTPKQITHFESEGKTYLAFNNQQLFEDAVVLGIVEDNSSDVEAKYQIKNYLEPLISKVTDWLDGMNLPEDPVKSLSLGGYSKKLERVITEFINKESPDATSLTQSPQKRKARSFLSSLENLIRYPLSNIIISYS